MKCRNLNMTLRLSSWRICVLKCHWFNTFKDMMTMFKLKSKTYYHAEFIQPNRYGDKLSRKLTLQTQDLSEKPLKKQQTSIIFQRKVNDSANAKFNVKRVIAQYFFLTQSIPIIWPPVEIVLCYREQVIHLFVLCYAPAHKFYYLSLTCRWHIEPRYHNVQIIFVTNIIPGAKHNFNYVNTPPMLCMFDDLTCTNAR